MTSVSPIIAAQRTCFCTHRIRSIVGNTAECWMLINSKYTPGVFCHSMLHFLREVSSHWTTYAIHGSNNVWRKHANFGKCSSFDKYKLILIISAYQSEELIKFYVLIRSRIRITDRCSTSLTKRNEPISLKRGVMIGPTNRKNFLTFDGEWQWLVILSRSLFHFPHHCGIADFRRFISISHTVTGRFS